MEQAAAVPAQPDGEPETQWVFPERFFDQLADVPADAPNVRFAEPSTPP
jgi:hypothetical protein